MFLPKLSCWVRNQQLPDHELEASGLGRIKGLEIVSRQRVRRVLYFEFKARRRIPQLFWHVVIELSDWPKTHVIFLMFLFGGNVFVPPCLLCKKNLANPKRYDPKGHERSSAANVLSVIEPSERPKKSSLATSSCNKLVLHRSKSISQSQAPCLFPQATLHRPL